MAVVVVVGPDHDGVAVDRHGVAEVVVRRGVGGRQLGHLAVRGAAVGRAEDVGRARVPPSSSSVGPDHDGVAVDRHGDAEVVVRRGVGGRQLGHLAVRGAAVGRAEDVGRARAGAGVVVALAPTTMVSPSIATEPPK